MKSFVTITLVSLMTLGCGSYSKDLSSNLSEQLEDQSNIRLIVSDLKNGDFECVSKEVLDLERVNAEFPNVRLPKGYIVTVEFAATEPSTGLSINEISTSQDATIKEHQDAFSKDSPLVKIIPISVAEFKSTDIMFKIKYMNKELNRHATIEISRKPVVENGEVFPYLYDATIETTRYRCFLDT